MDELEVRLVWGQHCERRVASSARVNELLRSLAAKWGRTEEEVESSVIKVVGEDAYLLDNHRLVDYEYVREKVALGRVRETMMLRVYIV